jgi:hypothetical protein
MIKHVEIIKHFNLTASAKGVYNWIPNTESISIGKNINS